MCTGRCKLSFTTLSGLSSPPATNSWDEPGYTFGQCELGFMKKWQGFKSVELVNLGQTPKAQDQMIPSVEQFGNSWKKLPVNIFFPWFCHMMSVCCPHLDKSAHWNILYRRCLRICILIRTTRIAPIVFIMFHFYPYVDVRIPILIGRRALAA